MTRHVTGATLLVLASIALTSCAAEEPAETTDEAIERTSTALELLVADKFSDEIADMLADEGWIERVATDIVENCDTPGFRDGYVGGFKDQPGMDAIVDEAWDIACSPS